MSIRHSKVSLLPDDPNNDLIRPSDWNANHIISPIDILHFHYVKEIPIKISSTKFKTLHDFTTNTLSVYLNGLKEKNIIEISNNEFKFDSDIYEDDDVEVEYFKIEV